MKSLKIKIVSWFNLRGLAALFILSTIVQTNAYTAVTPSLSGPVVVHQGNTETYTVLNPPANIGDSGWSIDGGILIGENATLTEITVQWTTLGSNKLISGTLFTATNVYLVGLSVQVNSSVSTPPAPTLGNAICGSTTLNRTGNVPAGETWYWQSSPSATNQSNYGSSYSATTDGTYYLRAKNGAIWGPTSAGLAVNVNEQSVGGNIIEQQSTGKTGEMELSDHLGNVFSWEQKIGGGSWQSTGVTSAALLYDVSGNTSFRASVQNGICPAVYSSIFIVEYDPITDQNINYVWTTNVLEAGVLSDAGFENANSENLRESIAYFDGLGRSNQTVLKQESPGSNDIVQHIEYDPFGRQVRTHLPYTSGTDGVFKSDAEAAQNSFHDTHYGGTSGNYAFSENTLEASPLGRVLQSFAPGASFANALDENGQNTGGGHKPVEYEYSFNDNTDQVLLWTIEQNELKVYDYYEPGALYKSITTDENTGTNEGEVIEFKDKQGRVVLKRVKKDASNYLETYYAYDDFGNLRFVLPPGFISNFYNYELKTSDVILTGTLNSAYAYFPTSSITVSPNATLQPGFKIVAHGITPTQSSLNIWAFQYKYDGRQRMIEKKVPGADWVYMVYDKRDRLVLSQDGNQRTYNKWSFTKYDALNRPIISGEKVFGSYAAVKTAVEAISVYAEFYALGGLHKYTNVAYPIGIVDTDINSVTYYDDYQYVSKSFIDPPSGRFTTEGSKILPVDFTSVKGQVIGTKTKVLGTTNQYTETVNFYDDRYRLIQTQMTNHYGGDDVLTTQYDFAGRVRKTFMEFNNPNGNIVNATIAQNFTYDHAGRLLTVDHSIDEAAAMIIVTNTYNELGELETKNLHNEGNSTFAQSIDYAYNMRGWLTAMNDPSVTDPAIYFSMQLKYDNASSGHQAYNGNIGTIDWKNPLESIVNTYDYDYDRVNRLTAADYNMSTDYDVTGISYDDNGNIKSLIRNGQKSNGSMGVFDNLTYSYVNGNQLSKVEDSSSDANGFKNGANQATEYTYDANGNMITDANKGIVDIDYNYLNLPEKVDMGSGNFIEYTYDAAGIKHQQKVYENNLLTKTTDYMGGFIYENNDLQFAQHDEGRLIPPTITGSGWEYQYGLKDHLGNTRVTFTTEDRVTNYLATLEDANNTAENEYFFNIDNRVTYPLGGKAVQLNNAAPIGVAISFGVVPGDKIDLSTKAYYTNTSGFGTGATNSGTFANAVSSAFGGLNGGVEGNQQFIYDLFTALGTALLSPAGNVDNQPSAYLNYLVFDQNYVLNTGKSGYVGIGANASTEQTLSASNIEIDQAGFVYIYVSNESNSSNYVYFDNLSVTVNESRILEKSDYYPFGLTFNSYNKAGMIGQKFKYNGKEEIKDLGVNWYDYGARMYMSDIGRWGAVDPLADSYIDKSPYQYVSNNPIHTIDPDGRGERRLGANEDAGTQHSGNHIDNSTTVSRSGKKIDVTHTETGRHSGTKQSTSEITLAKNVKSEHVTNKSATVVGENMKNSGNSSATITSAFRNPKDQARVMLKNVNKKGLSSQLSLYGPSGDKVLKTGAAQAGILNMAGVSNEATNSIVQGVMENKINELGPGNVSKHSSNPNVYNVLDIDPGSLTNQSGFENAVKGDNRIQKVITPNNSDPAVHIEIPQLK